MLSQLDRKDLKYCSIPCVFNDTAEKGVFTGYASVFGFVDGDKDVFQKGAFSNSLKKKDPKKIKMLWQHDVRVLLGFFECIREDEYGLFVKGRLLPDIPKAQEVYTLLKNGIIDALSVGFVVEKYRYDFSRNVRMIQTADLWEISLVTFPANSMARLCNVKAKIPKDDSVCWGILSKDIQSAIDYLCG